MRFDLRAPGASAAERAALHRTAVEMAAWADERSCGSIVISEHHASADGYLPSPFLLAAAIAAATSTTPIVVAATLLPLHDPVRLAEDIITLDHLSEGRAMVVLGVGYRPVEYELYGVGYHRRGAVAEEKLARLIELLRDAGSAPATGEAGAASERATVTPAPYTQPTPLLAWGGRSVAAARRAGRHGIGLFAQTDAPGLREAYEDAAHAAGHEPGLCVLPSPATPQVVFVHDDVDAGWAEVGPNLLADAVAYQDWSTDAGTAEGTASLSAGRTVAALRAERGAHRVVTPAGVRELIAEHGLLGLHPLCGGLPPAVAWPYLRRAVAAATDG